MVDIAMCERIAELESKLALQEEATRRVSEYNGRLEAKLERLEKAMLYAIGEIHCDCRKGYNCAVCVLTEALGEKDDV